MNKGIEKKQRTGLEVAVIGIAGRFPGAKNVRHYWENLKNEVESIYFFTDEELEKNGVSSEQLSNPNYVKAFGVLEDLEYFDASFFSYTPKEAEIMNPQVRHFYECSWQALEDAGYNPETYDGLIGVYAGATSSFNWEGIVLLSGKDREVGSFAARTLADAVYFPTRMSYKLNLKGPSFFIQSACSTSLAAIHMASRAVLSGECQMALAGGVRIGVNQTKGYLYEEGMILSPDGHCRAFSAEANGTVSGNGIGIVLLKRLKNAIADRDHIYAVIKGSAMNNDGNRKVGYTSPSVQGQADAIRTALAMARVTPESIGYIEAHGTGTPLGDPVEMEALTVAFNTDKRNYCPIGSVKSNFGHLDTAAGVAGFIKTVLVLKNKLIPPSLHFNSPNPKIDFENSPFYVNHSLTEWKSNGAPRRAGVSSFGIGGTNIHVILEEAPTLEDSDKSRACQVLLLSAKTQSALQRMEDEFVAYLKNNPSINIADATYTLTIGRKHFNYRKMVVCSSLEDTINVFSTPESTKVHESVLTGKDEDKPVVFMFPGQGAQYIDMGLDLYRAEPLFRREMDDCFHILKSLLDFDIKELLYPSETQQEQDLTDPTSSPEKSLQINQTEITQAVIFIFEYAMAKMLMVWGIKPYAMSGHSIGEYTAACLAGVFSLEDALKTVVCRGKLMQRMPTGSMLSIPLPEKEIKPFLDDQISLAAVNSSSRCVVSGNHKSIDKLKSKLHAMGFESTLLHTSHAFHSNMMEPILNEFKDHLDTIELNEPGIPYISNLTGKWIGPEESKNPGYWVKHLRNTVRFSGGIETLLEKEHAVFIEVGPGNALSTFVRQHKNKKKSHVVVDTVRKPKDQTADDYFLLNKIGQLWLYGVKIDWPKFYENQKRQRISLPGYSFDRHRFHIDENAILTGKGLIAEKTLHKKKNIKDWFYVPSWKRSIFPVTNQSGTEEKFNWLIFLDDRGVGFELAKKLEKNNHHVINVQMGPEFQKISRHQFSINPGESNGYIKLLADLKRTEKIPSRIIHLWSLKDIHIKIYDAETFESCLDIHFYSLLYLAQAIGKDITSDINIDIVTADVHDVNGTESLHPERAAVLGPCKTIPQEFPNIRCRCIDIELPRSKNAVKAGLDKLNNLFQEISTDHSDMVVAHRNNRRWVQIFEPLPLEDSLEEKVTLTLKQRGVYLITGGLGRIGFTMGRYLAKEFQARLILTGSSEFPPRDHWQQWVADKDPGDTISRKIKKVLELEDLGAKVLVFSANVADAREMQMVIKEAEIKFAPIDGVIHAAGVVRGHSIDSIGNLDKSKCNMQLQPKLQGLLVLEKLLVKKDLDFFMLTSSLAAILGGLGFMAYSTANILMDAYTHYHNRTASSHWISVNWDGWRVSERSGHHTSRGTLADLAMEPDEGTKAFLRILSCSNTSQVVNSTGDLQLRINQWIKLESVQEEGSDAQKQGTIQQRPNLTTPYIEPRNEIEQDLCDIWKKLFGYELIGIDDDFHEIGGDSLKAVTITAQIKKIGYPTNLAEMLMAQTIRKLAEIISQKGVAIKTAEELYEENLLSKLECIEKLNHGRNEKTMFFIHPAHGMVNQYKELALLLEKNYNVYGIQARGVKPGTKMWQNPIQMIDDYLEQILALQSSGPYIIAGYCIGVAVAYELVRRLESLGHVVEKLIIVDEPSSLPDHYLKMLRVLEYLPDSFKKILLYLTAKQFKKKIQTIKPPAIDGGDGELYKEKFIKYLNTLIRHITPVAIIKASIFAPFADTSEYERGTAEHLGKLTSGDVTVLKIPGEHNTLFETPWVEKLAEVILNM
jgi:acyl transferase domain-containing protein/nucleoside-triphosphatase THEP1